MSKENYVLEKNLRISTICSHSALQIFHGAKKEGFKTVGICKKEYKEVYERFPLAKPDGFILVNSYEELLNKEIQNDLLRDNALIIPHGSFVSYIKPAELVKKLRVPIFGNKFALLWESDRNKQKEWFEKARISSPKTYNHTDEIDCDTVFVKFHGAKGGRGYFVCKPEELKQLIKSKGLSLSDVIIQEFAPGVRYYPHFFYSPLEKRVELLGMDKRIETIDESYRGLGHAKNKFIDYTVSGNMPVVLRESLLKELFDIAERLIKTSKELFPPGIIGPFCLETVYHPENGFRVFEVSSRIVAGTNLFPTGSFYSTYFFDEPMSMGRRIAREIKNALKKGVIEKVVS